MLKKIKVEELTLGMHLHEMCGSWMSHPFFRTAFKLTNSADIARIVDSSVREVWIDSERGLDVDSGESGEEVEAKIGRTLVQAASAADTSQVRVSVAEEIQRAAQICARSKRALVAMFREARMGNAIEAERALQLVDDISSSVMRNPFALISIARLKRADEYTYMHSVAVCGLMLAVARQMELDEQQTRDAGLAGLLHDVGKMAIPDSVLKKPGQLTDAEFSLMKSHPEEGHRLLLAGKDIGGIVLDVCLHHHERVDGRGYPQRLPGDKLNLFAKMCAVCDVYDAVTSDRPYKKGADPAEAVRKMAEWSNGHFELSTFHAFVKTVGIYPIGTLVRLRSGRLGVVVEQSKSLLMPKINVFFSTKSQVRLPPEIIDLSGPGHGEKVAGIETPSKWGFSNLEEIWHGPGCGAW